MDGVTYAEARAWAVTLRTFTPTDLADVMAVNPDSIDGFIMGLLFNGTIYDTGHRVNGRGPEQPIYEFVPLPPGPTEHETGTPEWRNRAIGCGMDAPQRGLPVYLENHQKRAKMMSLPGQGHKMRVRDKRRRAMAARSAERDEENRARTLARKMANMAREAKRNKAAKERRRVAQQELLGED